MSGFTWDIDKPEDRARYYWPQDRVIHWWKMGWDWDRLQHALDEWSYDWRKHLLEGSKFSQAVFECVPGSADEDLRLALNGEWLTEFGTGPDGTPLRWDPFHLPLFDPNTGALSPKHPEFEGDAAWHREVRQALRDALVSRMKIGADQGMRTPLHGVVLPPCTHLSPDVGLAGDRQRLPISADLSLGLMGPNLSFHGAQFRFKADGAQAARAFQSAGASFGDNAQFGYAEFQGRTVWGGSWFGDNAFFVGARFAGSAEFLELVFGTEPRFDAACFERLADFSNSQLGEWANFWATRFNSEARFVQSVFGSRPKFWATNFLGTCDFSLSKFVQDADFGQSQFGHKSDFAAAHFRGHASFMAARFSGDANFSWLKNSGCVEFTGAKFSRRLDFVGVDLQGTKAATEMGGLTFENCDLGPNPNFQGVIYDRRCLSGRWTGVGGAQNIFGDAHFRRDVLDQDYIDTMRARVCAGVERYRILPREMRSDQGASEGGSATSSKLDAGLVSFGMRTIQLGKRGLFHCLAAGMPLADGVDTPRHQPLALLVAALAGWLLGGFLADDLTAVTGLALAGASVPIAFSMMCLVVIVCMLRSSWDVLSAQSEKVAPGVPDKAMRFALLALAAVLASVRIEADALAVMGWGAAQAGWAALGAVLAVAVVGFLNSSLGRFVSFWMWGLFDYGRQWDRVLMFGTMLIVVFGFAYRYAAGAPEPFVTYDLAYENAFTPWFAAAMGFATLGLVDVMDANRPLGQVLMILNVLSGFFTLGLVLAVLGNTFARRS